MDKKNSGELAEIQKKPTLDKKAFLTEDEQPKRYLSNDVVEIELFKRLFAICK